MGSARIFFRFVPIMLKKSKIPKVQFSGENQLCRAYHPNARCALLKTSYKEKSVGDCLPSRKFGSFAHKAEAFPTTPKKRLFQHNLPSADC